MATENTNMLGDIPNDAAHHFAKTKTETTFDELNYEQAQSMIGDADEILTCVPPQIEAVAKLIWSIDPDVGLMDDRDFQQIGYMLQNMASSINEADNSRTVAENYFWLRSPAKYISGLLGFDANEENQLELLIASAKKRRYS